MATTVINENNLTVTTMRFPHLFREGKIGNCILKNRFIMSLFPTKYSTDSRVNERMIEFYRERARGGVAMIVLDCPCLDYPRAYKGSNQLRFDTPEFADGIAKLINSIHAQGAKAFMQLDYPKERSLDHEIPGAKRKGNLWLGFLPEIMTPQDAGQIIEIMSAGSKRARELGYDGIEIQASYGEFISQLLSPLSNKRKDEYGGSLENRSRFLTTLIERVKQQAGSDYPVIVKLVCDEFLEGGLTISDTTHIANLVERAGADAIFASGGNKATKRMSVPMHYLSPGSLLHLAKAMKKAVTIPVIAVGKINTPELAEKAIREGEADFVAMARALIADPNLPEKARKGIVKDICGCLYDLEDCYDKGIPGIGRACAVNPFSGQEYRLKITPAGKKKRVVVVGGGPAGMQSALIVSQRGHKAILFEREGSLGGQLRLAWKAPFKDEVGEILRYLEHSLGKTSIKIIFGTTATEKEVLSQEPDVVIIALGSKPILPNIPGADLPFVFDVRAVYEKPLELGLNVIIVGAGDIGCETADLLSEQARNVTIVELLDEPLKRMNDLPKAELLGRLKKKWVQILTSMEVMAIEKGHVIVASKDGIKKKLTADSVIFSVGSGRVDFLYGALKDSVKEVYVVGDAKEPGNLGAALRSATEVGLQI